MALPVQKKGLGDPSTQTYIGSQALVVHGSYRVFTTDGTAVSHTTTCVVQWEMHRICSITVI